jgi:hypothetical protein
LQQRLAGPKYTPTPRKRLTPTAAVLSAVYDEHKDEDGFLYVFYSGQSSFGASL